MNLNAIKRNCKARRTARVFNAIHGGQWPDLDREAAEAEEAAEALLKKIDAGDADDEPGGH